MVGHARDVGINQEHWCLMQTFKVEKTLDVLKNEQLIVGK